MLRVILRALGHKRSVHIEAGGWAHCAAFPLDQETSESSQESVPKITECRSAPVSSVEETPQDSITGGG